MTNILVIDDNKDMREIIYELLIDEGFSVSLADGPDAAMSFLSQSEFDLVICDLVMPIEAGQECAIVGVKTISRIVKEHPGLPVIAISGELTGTPLNHINTFGARNTLSKPFGREELLQKINTVLHPN